MSTFSETEHRVIVQRELAQIRRELAQTSSLLVELVKLHHEMVGYHRQYNKEREFFDEHTPPEHDDAS